MSETRPSGTVISITTTYVVQYQSIRSRTWSDCSYRPCETKDAAERIRAEHYEPEDTRVIKRTITDELA